VPLASYNPMQYMTVSYLSNRIHYYYYLQKNPTNNNTVSIDKVAIQQYYLKIQHQKQ